MKTIARMTCVAAGAAMLAGCQSFPLTSWMFKSGHPAGSSARQFAGLPDGALEEGRTALREGNISAAIASFRIALLDPAMRAEACNGLAVAYAKLGRDDLAQRYFLAAVSAEPDNPRFVANLLRLQRQQQVNLAARAAAAPAIAVQQPQPAPLPVQSSDRLAQGLTERLSRGEVRIRVRPDLGNAPTMAVGEREPQQAPSDQARVAILSAASIAPTGE